jgi:hypothetical protein
VRGLPPLFFSRFEFLFIAPEATLFSKLGLLPVAAPHEIPLGGTAD